MITCRTDATVGVQQLPGGPHQMVCTISVCSMFRLWNFLFQMNKYVTAKVKAEHDGFSLQPKTQSVYRQLLINFPNEEPHKLKHYTFTSVVIMKCLLNILTINSSGFYFLQRTFVSIHPSIRKCCLLDRRYM